MNQYTNLLLTSNILIVLETLQSMLICLLCFVGVMFVEKIFWLVKKVAGRFKIKKIFLPQWLLYQKVNFVSCKQALEM